MESLEKYHIHEQEWDSLEEIDEYIEWSMPDELNMAYYICDQWANEKDRVALFYEDEHIGREGIFTFSQLKNETNRLANYLGEFGVEKGDRVAVNSSQKPETLISYIAIWKLGAIPVPLSKLFGPDAIEYRLKDSGACYCIIDGSNLDTYNKIRDLCAAIEQTLVINQAETAADDLDFWSTIEGHPQEFEITRTAPEDAMLLMYTSGTTGKPKGVVQPHRALVGHLPGIITNYYNCEINETDIRWIPSEWTWAASISTIIGALYFGRPVVAAEREGGFDPEKAFMLIEKYDITIPLLPPTALRMMMSVDDVNSRYNLDSVRLIISGGESVGENISNWSSEVFDATVHEGYGQTEGWNMLIGDCTAYGDSIPGWMGYALPGHEIEIVDLDTSEVLEPNTIGEIAIKADDPTVFKEYWNRPEKTTEKFSGKWMLTEDLAKRDENGRFKFISRKDDVIISAGYRISPAEIEDTITAHEASSNAGVIGVSDDERGEVPKAFIELKHGYNPSENLKHKIRNYVREHLAAYEYPRRIEFLDELPLTTGGKVQRTKLREYESNR